MFDITSLTTQLLNARKTSKYKQADVASYLGITQSAYSDLENGKRDITLRQLLQLSELYKLPLNILIGNDDPRLTMGEQVALKQFRDFLIYNRNKK